MQHNLLLTGGEVIDARAGLRGVDLALTGGRIAAVAPSPPSPAARPAIAALDLPETGGGT